MPDRAGVRTAVGRSRALAGFGVIHGDITPGLRLSVALLHQVRLVRLSARRGIRILRRSLLSELARVDGCVGFRDTPFIPPEAGRDGRRSGNTKADAP